MLCAGLSGKGCLIQDVNAYDGPYYECSSKVLSELCVPILHSQTGEVIGIIDAESWYDQYDKSRLAEVGYSPLWLCRKASFFTQRVSYEILKVCIDLAAFKLL